MGYFGIFCNINNVIKQKLSKLSMNLEAEFKKKRDDFGVRRIYHFSSFA